MLQDETMSQVTTGIRGVLSHPFIYDIVQNVAGARKFSKIYVAEYVRPRDLERVLDIGCGTADILAYLPETVTYTGFDASPDYINAARTRFGKRGDFQCREVNELTLDEPGAFDIVLANGLMHHLDDREVGALCRVGAKALKPGGRMITHDPCYCDRQSRMAQYLIAHDRGQNVRIGEDYLALLRPFFSHVELSVRHDMVYVPYTHAIITATK